MYSSTLAQLGQWQQEQERMIQREEETAKRDLPVIKAELQRLQGDRTTLEEYLREPDLMPAQRTEYSQILQTMLQTITELTERKRVLESVRVSAAKQFAEQTAYATGRSQAQYHQRQAHERERGRARRELARRVLPTLGQWPQKGGGMRGFVQRLLQRRREL